ncbi:hypothetical protein [Pedobacter hartonius]|uniref:Uncharacterized protein n=1 Tax=Pedobacter hartonius TaxID=425514 RepID=A0A1H4GEI0_9SPHI|nr:hypothetical protein [Pedobacter hartonius]SEB07122.1 hypothetical protein SAMN05443550_109210 [Pedobacter hartonius]
MSNVFFSGAPLPGYVNPTSGWVHELALRGEKASNSEALRFKIEAAAVLPGKI